ncbi:hypothetical protein [Actinoplanes sp. N902-109]|uniref:hypothetical protein n=1 Tax=Actinoplanes sp. (strain N902-109) TaxID=649831 RepID=UPI0005A05206|nr:hypothetical protein [Actinoplanes sp. N902-109]
MTGTELMRIQVLDRLYNYQPEQSGAMAGFAYIVGGVDLDHDEQSLWVDVLHNLADKGLIMVGDSLNFDGYSALIKGRGRAEVEARRVSRANPGARRRAARDAVLAGSHHQR